MTVVQELAGEIGDGAGHAHVFRSVGIVTVPRVIKGAGIVRRVDEVKGARPPVFVPMPDLIRPNA